MGNLILLEFLECIQEGRNHTSRQTSESKADVVQVGRRHTGRKTSYRYTHTHHTDRKKTHR